MYKFHKINDAGARVKCVIVVLDGALIIPKNAREDLELSVKYWRKYSED